MGPRQAYNHNMFLEAQKPTQNPEIPKKYQKSREPKGPRGTKNTTGSKSLLR